MKKSIIHCLPLLLFGASLFKVAYCQEPVKVLFIGNSFTYYSDLPGKFKALATAAGQNVTVDSYATAGANVVSNSQQTGHVDNPLVYSKIHSQAWDYVVIQDNGAYFAGAVHSIPYGALPANIRLRDSVRTIHPCSSVIWFASWGPVGGAGYVANDNTAYTNNRTDTNYQYMNNMYPSKKEIIAPFGKAWNAATLAKPTIQNSLYYGDQVHPAAAGQLLNASVLYTTIFKQDPSNINYTGGVNATDAAFLRNIGYQTVMKNYIYATHNLASISPAITFSNGTLSAPSGYSSYQWYLNNVLIPGATSSTYVPLSPGSYCFIATDNNNCKHFQSFPYIVSMVGIAQYEFAHIVNVYPNPFLLYTTVDLTGIVRNASDQLVFCLYNLEGNEVLRHDNITGNSLQVEKKDMAEGVYIYKLLINDLEISRGKLIVQ